MDVLKMRNQSRVVLRITGPQLWVLSVHWLGKTLLCAGEEGECSGCKLERPKVRGYAEGVVRLAGGESHSGLIEVTGDVVEQLVLRGMEPLAASGWTWLMESSVHSRRWKVMGAEQVKMECTDGERLPEALELLFGLPRLVDDEGLPTLIPGAGKWLKAHGMVIEAKMRWACQKGSHKMA